MTLLDIALTAALAVFVLAWWVRGMPSRKYVLLAAALGAVGFGAADFIDTRWQAAIGVIAGVVFLAVLLVNLLRKTDKKTGAPFVSGVVFALIGALGVAAIVLFPVDPLPKPSGQYAVGVREFEVADASRLGVFAAGETEPRRLLVRVWYPAGDVAGMRPRPYFTDAEALSTAQGLGILSGFPLFFTYVKHVQTNSYVDAPLMADAHALPMVIYSHGYTSFLAQNTVLMEELASHGYVVFSLQHTYDSSPTVFPNGDVAPMDPALIEMTRREMSGGTPPETMVNTMAGLTLDSRFDGRLQLMEEAAAGDERISHSALIWVADRIFLHNQLQQGAVPAPIQEIARASNLAHVGEIGMSFGGATSGALCYVDRRCAAAINLDGGDFHFTPFDADIPVPFLMFHSDMMNAYRQFGRTPEGPARGYNEFSYERFEVAGTRSDVTRVQLRGSHHLGLSDFSLFVRRPVRDGLFGDAPARVMIGAQNDFVRGFFDRYLRGEANGFPETQMAAYRDWISPASNADVPAWWTAKSEADRTAIRARIDAAKALAARRSP